MTRVLLAAGTCIVLLAVLLTISAQAAPVTSAGYFAGTERTFISFETDRYGTLVNLPNGDSKPMPGDEYASLGVTFAPSIYWLNDGGTNFDLAQVSCGSPITAVFPSSRADFTINFTKPVSAFGCATFRNNTYALYPTFTALDSEGGVIESVTFGTTFKAGTVGVVDYGFMGISANRAIYSVSVTGHAYAAYDDFYFQTVPEPSGVLALITGLSGLGVIYRRRR